MADLTELSVNGFLDQTAARTPTPGGGSVAALAGALACAMARMVAEYSVSKEPAPEANERVGAVLVRLRRAELIMRALITSDAEAYAALSAASKSANRPPAGRSRRADALLKAISVPMETAAVASNVLSTLDEFKDAASKYLLSDLGVAAVLADATARAAAYSVMANAHEMTDEAVRTRIMGDANETVTRCGRLCASVEQFVRSRLEIAESPSR